MVKIRSGWKIFGEKKKKLEKYFELLLQIKQLVMPQLVSAEGSPIVLQKLQFTQFYAFLMNK